jgi:hypothetical protein
MTAHVATSWRRFGKSFDDERAEIWVFSGKDQIFSVGPVSPI